MPKYTLKYFNARGRAEISRLVFAQAGVEFEDVRYTSPFEKPEEWAKVKATIRFGKLPVLAVDGEELSQSHAIAFYLAREFGLAGKTSFEAGRTYEVYFHAQDLIEAAYKVKFEKDEAKKTELKKTYLETDIPRLFGALETLIGDQQYFVASGLTIGDLNAFIVTDGLQRLKAEHPQLEGLLEKFPKLLAHHARVAALPNISAWLAKRPDTPF